MSPALLSPLLHPCAQVFTGAASEQVIEILSTGLSWGRVSTAPGCRLLRRRRQESLGTRTHGPPSLPSPAWGKVAAGKHCTLHLLKASIPSTARLQEGKLQGDPSTCTSFTPDQEKKNGTGDCLAPAKTLKRQWKHQNEKFCKEAHHIRLWRVSATLPYLDFIFTTHTLPRFFWKISGFRVISTHAVFRKWLQQWCQLLVILRNR